MELNFTKLQGAQNDFIFLEGDQLPLTGEQIRRLCHRRRGIGADGIVLLSPGERWTMSIWNGDGSPAGMCGNAARCAALYLDRTGCLRGDRFELNTADGIKEVIIKEQGEVYRVQVDLGPVRWNPEEVPVLFTGHPFLEREIEVNGTTLRVSALSLGNPHCVWFTDDLSDDNINTLGPALENHPLFPDRCNVEFARVLSKSEVQVRVWERGCGETPACGTGAAAVCAAANETGRTGRKILCRMPGGTLEMERVASGRILKTGPAEWSFAGRIAL